MKRKRAVPASFEQHQFKRGSNGRHRRIGEQHGPVDDMGGGPSPMAEADAMAPTMASDESVSTPIPPRPRRRAFRGHHAQAGQLRALGGKLG